MGKYFRIVILSSLLISLFLDLPGFLIGLNRDLADNQLEIRRMMHFVYRFASHFLLAMILFQFNINWKYKKLGKSEILKFWPVTIVINILIAFALSRLFFELDFHPHRGFRMFMRHATGVSNLSLVAMVMLISRLLEVLMKNQAVALENQQLKTENLQNQYKALKNQLDPHFLFNSLNTLLDLIEEDKKLASGFVNKLSEVFRYLLTHSKAQLIPLTQEVEFVNNYLYLLKMRHTHLTVNIELESNELSEKWKVPPLAIQLLIENAVKHNEISKSHPLEIKVKQSGETLRITNLIQPKKQVEPGEGMGLQNLMKRYDIISGKEVHVSKHENEFIVEIPLII